LVDRQVDTAQRLGSTRGIGEADVLQLHPAGPSPWIDRFDRLWRRRWRTQEFVESSERDLRLDPLIEDSRQLLDRREELVEVQQESDQQSRYQAALTDETSAVPQHDRLGEGAEQLATGKKDRHQLHRLQSDVAVLLRSMSEAHGIVVVTSE